MIKAEVTTVDGTQNVVFECVGAPRDITCELSAILASGLRNLEPYTKLSNKKLVRHIAKMALYACKQKKEN